MRKHQPSPLEQLNIETEGICKFFHMHGTHVTCWYCTARLICEQLYSHCKNMLRSYLLMSCWFNAQNHVWMGPMWMMAWWWSIICCLFYRSFTWVFLKISVFACRLFSHISVCQKTCTPLKFGRSFRICFLLRTLQFLRVLPLAELVYLGPLRKQTRISCGAWILSILIFSKYLCRKPVPSRRFVDKLTN